MRVYTNQISLVDHIETSNFESEKPRVAEKDFQKMLEKERLKIGMLPYLFNFQNMFLTAPSEFDLSRISDIQKNSMYLDTRSPSLTRVYRSDPHFSSTKAQGSSAGPNVTGAVSLKHGNNVAQERSIQDGLEKVFYVNLSVIPELQDILMEAKSRIPSIRDVSLDDMLNLILDKAKVLKNSEKTELILKLKPEDLGNIIVSITKQEGVINISIYAKESTRDLIEQNMGELEANLKNMNIGGLQVSISGNGKNDFNAEGAEYLDTLPVFALSGRELPDIIYIDNIIAERSLGIEKLQYIYSNA